MSHREQSQYMRVLNRLKEEGRVSNGDLNRISNRFGDIIFNLRRAGHIIQTVAVDPANGHWDYVYKGKEEEKPRFVERLKEKLGA